MTLEPNMYYLLPIFMTPIGALHGLHDPHCHPPYECISAHQCAEKLSAEAVDKVLFRCQDRSKICCPTTRTTLRTSTRTPYVSEPTIHPSGSIAHPAGNHMGKIDEHCTRCHFNRRPGLPIPTTTAKMVTESAAKEDINFIIKSHKNIRLLPSKCGSANFLDKITEGEEAGLGEFPWMALIGIKGRFTQDRNGHRKWFCGGTLINQRYVLTAAHCIYRHNPSALVVRLGEHNIQNQTDCDNNQFCLDPPKDFDAEEILIHRDWDSTTIKNDIALFRLSSIVSESFSISPICLPWDMKKRNSSEELKYEVAGWGQTEWNSQPGSNVLRKAVLSAVSNEDCNLCKAKRKERYCPITSKQICAQGWKSVDVCKGDSGGPLMTIQLKMYQMGITSFKASEYCGADNIPSIFTRIESYLEWILDNIRD